MKKLTHLLVLMIFFVVGSMGGVYLYKDHQQKLTETNLLHNGYSTSSNEYDLPMPPIDSETEELIKQYGFKAQEIPIGVKMNFEHSKEASEDQVGMIITKNGILMRKGYVKVSYSDFVNISFKAIDKFFPNVDQPIPIELFRKMLLQYGHAKLDVDSAGEQFPDLLIHKAILEFWAK